MQSHRDKDAPMAPKALRELTKLERAKFTQALEKRAAEMIERDESLITTGRDGERVLFEERRGGLLLRRLEADPDRVLRVSLGAPEWEEGQAYLVFRGDPQKVLALVQRAERKLRQALKRRGPTAAKGETL